jgi:hypothetical protein
MKAGPPMRCSLPSCRHCSKVTMPDAGSVIIFSGFELLKIKTAFLTCLILA